MKAARIATWNLERPKSRATQRRARQIELIKSTKADLWILTESNQNISLNGYHSISTNPAQGYHTEGECFAMLLSRWPILRTIPTHDPVFAVCAELDSPFGPMIAYGTIITYANDRGRSRKSARWVEHRKSIERHDADWRRLRAEFPNHSFCIGGDFNQNRDGTVWYGDAQSVVALGSALEASGVQCVTQEDFRASGKLQTRASIDHICLSDELADRKTAVGAWEGTVEGTRLSDHNGVFVDLRL